MADYFLGDLYPTMGHLTTRTGTIPEPADQTTLIDNQRQALENPIECGRPGFMPYERVADRQVPCQCKMPWISRGLVTRS